MVLQVLSFRRLDFYSLYKHHGLILYSKQVVNLRPYLFQNGINIPGN